MQTNAIREGGELMRFSKQQLRIIKNALVVDIAAIDALLPRVTRVSIPSLLKERSEYETIIKIIEEDE